MEQLTLMVHEGQAWLVRGAWSQRVDLPEFIAWAAYSGVDLLAIDGCGSQAVALDTPIKARLFELMWSCSSSHRRRH
jgi:hypothetical protein